MASSSAIASAALGAASEAAPLAGTAALDALAGAGVLETAPTIQIGSPLTLDASSGSCAFGPNAFTMASTSSRCA